MRVLVLGSTGRVGWALTRELLTRGISVRALVRTPSKLADMASSSSSTGGIATENLETISAEASKLSVSEMATHMRDCDAVAIALGHPMNVTGILMDQKFVTAVTGLVFDAAESLHPTSPIRFAILSTPGFVDPRPDNCDSFGVRMLLRTLQTLLVPPADNQSQANMYLAKPLTKDIEWCAVRPYNFVERNERSNYATFEKMTEGVLAARETSVVNIGHFMAELVEKTDVWEQWKGKAVVMRNE